jgi:hypothetical protein
MDLEDPAALEKYQMDLGDLADLASLVSLEDLEH